MVSQFTGEINAAFCIVMHLSKVTSNGFLATNLQKHTTLVCKTVEDHEAIKKHMVYIAPPDKHLVVKGEKLVLTNGPFENRWRPSIDVLFRSAAANFNTRTIGIILTGLLDDGTAGMVAIKKCGGSCIVQDPEEAEFPDMPVSVLNTVEVEYRVSLTEMGQLLKDITAKLPKKEKSPLAVIKESEMDANTTININKVQELGRDSLFACPDCGGGLWEIKDNKFTRYRCHIGHVYSEADLLLKQEEAMESTLWTAIRMMEERRNLLWKIAGEEDRKGWAKMASMHKERAESLTAHIDRMKELLFALKAK